MKKDRAERGRKVDNRRKREGCCGPKAGMRGVMVRRRQKITGQKLNYQMAEGKHQGVEREHRRARSKRMV
jgi:hypothetical protein